MTGGDPSMFDKEIAGLSLRKADEKFRQLQELAARLEGVLRTAGRQSEADKLESDISALRSS
jgi:hypothetical protein